MFVLLFKFSIAKKSKKLVLPIIFLLILGLLKTFLGKSITILYKDPLNYGDLIIYF